MFNLGCAQVVACLHSLLVMGDVSPINTGELNWIWVLLFVGFSCLPAFLHLVFRNMRVAFVKREGAKALAAGKRDPQEGAKMRLKEMVVTHSVIVILQLCIFVAVVAHAHVFPFAIMLPQPGPGTNIVQWESRHGPCAYVNASYVRLHCDEVTGRFDFAVMDSREAFGFGNLRCADDLFAEEPADG